MPETAGRSPIPVRGSPSKVKILLLQARHTHDRARLEEVRSFAEQAGVDEECITSYDLLGGAPTLAAIRQHDALMIGGSGDYYVSKANLPDFTATLAVLAEVVRVGHPTFASCFGFHLLVQALGGSIVHDADNMEVGTYMLTLTDAGRQDELFGALPGTFPAQLGHKDRAGILPAGVRNLAFSEKAPFQALRIPGKPIWATQFHPELTGAENRRRFHRYLDGYAGLMSPEELQATLDRFADSPQTDSILPAFLQLVFG